MLKKEIDRLLHDSKRRGKEDPEFYTDFAESRREGDKTAMKQHFSSIIDVSMKVLEKADSTFIWIDQLRRIVPPQMMTHLLVASELLMGATNATVHVLKDNIQNIKAPKRREFYLKRLTEVHKASLKRHRDLMEEMK